MVLLRSFRGATRICQQQTRGFLAGAYDVLKESDSVELKQLSNGLRVVTKPNGRQTAVVGVWVDSGTSYEIRENNGVAKFYKHLISKGTAKRTKAQLESELGKLGAWLCTTVDRDHTAYYVNCLSSDVEKAVEILADVLKNSKFDEADIEKERNILLLNLQEADENYAGTMWNFLHSAAFQGTGYENSPLGNTEAIKAMTRDDIFEFAEDQLKPVRMVFTGCGGIEHSRITELAEEHFGTLNNTYKRKIPIAGSVRFTGSEFRYRNDNIPIMHGAIAVEGVPLSHPDALALKVANEAVGEWDHSQASSENAPNVVTQKVCTNGELLSFENFSVNYTKTGLFGFKFSAHGHAVEPLQEGIFPILRQWKHLAVGVTDQEVDRAKTRLKVNLFQNLETNENEAKHFATQVLGTGKVTQLSELWKQIDNIDAGDVREALSRHVYDREIACAGVGRTEAFPNYFILRNAMSWWRL